MSAFFVDKKLFARFVFPSQGAIDHSGSELVRGRLRADRVKVLQVIIEDLVTGGDVAGQ